jgi:hypothetical protein
MLNKNQSNKEILEVRNNTSCLSGFCVCFQIEVVAQEK